MSSAFELWMVLSAGIQLAAMVGTYLLARQRVRHAEQLARQAKPGSWVTSGDRHGWVQVAVIDATALMPTNSVATQSDPRA